MTDAAILELLCSHLADIDLSPELPIAYPNTELKPVIGTPYLRADHLVTPMQQPGLSHDGYKKYLGVFQVTVFAPRGGGAILALDTVSAVLEHFARGTRMSSGSLVVEIGPEGPTANTPLQEEAWWYQPCSINWFALV